MSLDLGQLALWQNITVAILIGLTFIFFAVYLVIAFGCSLSLTKSYFKTLNKNEELKNTLLENELQLKIQELKYLKMQRKDCLL